MKDLLIVARGSNASSSLVLIAFSVQPYFDVRLPAGDDPTSLLHLAVQIRDTLDCVTALNLSSMKVTTDTTGISDLISVLQASSPTTLTNNPLVQLLSSGNQNTVGQVVTSLSQYFNKMNSESVQSAVSSQSSP